MSLPRVVAKFTTTKLLLCAVRASIELVALAVVAWRRRGLVTRREVLKDRRSPARRALCRAEANADDRLAIGRRLDGDLKVVLGSGGRDGLVGDDGGILRVLSDELHLAALLAEEYAVGRATRVPTVGKLSEGRARQGKGKVCSRREGLEGVRGAEKKREEKEKKIHIQLLVKLLCYEQTRCQRCE